MLSKHSRPIAFLTALTIAISLWNIHFSHFGIRVIMMPIFLSGAFGFFWLGSQTTRPSVQFWAYISSGLFLGITPWTHPTGRLAPLVLISYVGWLLVTRRTAARPILVSAALVVAVLVSGAC